MELRLLYNNVKSSIRYITIAILLLSLLVIFAMPVFAISDPDSVTISSVFVYRHCLEDNDQLYIAEYNIEYAANPDETVSQAFIARLLNDSDIELTAIAPYAYYDDGYGKGIFAMYFTADEVTDLSMTWEGSYQMKLMGNPSLTWAGDPPVATRSSFDSWSSSTSIETTKNEISSRVLFLADYLEQQWADIDLITSSSSAGEYLAEAGTEYFTATIPYLRTIAPTIFFGSTTGVDWPSKSYSQNYADTLTDGIIGTPFDLSPIADIFGVSTMWISSILYLSCVMIFLFFLVRGIGSAKPAIILSVPLVIMGTLLGLLPLVLAIMFGFMALVITAFALFYHPSGA